MYVHCINYTTFIKNNIILCLRGLTKMSSKAAHDRYKNVAFTIKEGYRVVACAFLVGSNNI